MRYGIIANPVSGTLGADGKERVLKRAARHLGNCRIYGLDTTSPADFRACAGHISRELDVLLVAGGDGTLSTVINAVDLDKIIIGHIPAGSGNAFGSALGLPRRAGRIARRIKKRVERAQVSLLDLIRCGNKKATMSSVGNDSHILRESEWYKSAGARGMAAYLFPTVKFILNSRKFNSEIMVDGEKFEARDMFSLIITKHPFYGGGLRMVPRARLNDAHLHLAYIDSRLDKLAYILWRAFSRGRTVGRYDRGKKIRITTDTPQYLQVDGEVERQKRTEFEFEILPGKLRFVF